jgi:hypothetical protein
VGQRWHHVRTDDGWEIRDENALLVASVHNPAHDREGDARLLASAPRLRERLNRWEPDAATQRARLIKEQVQWEAMGWVSSQRAQQFHAGVKRLANARGRNPAGVLAEIQGEAHKIIVREAEGT